MFIHRMATRGLCDWSWASGRCVKHAVRKVYHGKGDAIGAGSVEKRGFKECNMIREKRWSLVTKGFEGGT